jgi:uncharacterized protein
LAKPNRTTIDREIGKLEGDLIAGKALIKYLRYNFPITENDLNSLGLNQTFTGEDVLSLIEMSNSQNRELLYKIGFAASETVKVEHFS